jgi:hypothetical protein
MVLFPLLNSKDILLDGLIDVGCNEPFNNSDTAFFDDKLNIICIDPIDYTSLYNELRKKVKFINVGIDDHQGKLLFYKVRQIDGWEDQMSSFNIPESRFKYDVVEVSIDRLENIINANREFLGSNYGLLIDVEGRHMNVLKSINFEVNRPVFIMLECHAFDLEVYRYLKLNNYKYRYRVGYGDSVFINNFIDS